MSISISSIKSNYQSPKINFGAKMPGRIELSKNDILMILGQNPKNEPLGAVIEVCRRLTGIENVTKYVANKCRESLANANEVFATIARSMERCHMESNNPLEVNGIIVKNRKRLSTLMDKNNPRIKVSKIVINKEEYANDLLETARKLQENALKEQAKREARKAKKLQLKLEEQNKKEWQEYGQKELEYVKSVSQKNANVGFIYPKKPMSEQKLEKIRREITKTFEQLPQENFESFVHKSGGNSAQPKAYAFTISDNKSVRNPFDKVSLNLTLN